MGMNTVSKCGVKVGRVVQGDNAVAKTASWTVTSADNGRLFLIGAADLVATLPSVFGNRGMRLGFIVKTLSASTGFTITPAAADYIGGGGVGVTDAQSLRNTAATDTVGDAVWLYCDGTDGWIIESLRGTWAKV